MTSITTQAEQAIIGACLSNPDVIETVCSKLKRSDFSEIRHAKIFGDIETLIANNLPVDIITMSEQSEREGRPSPLSYLNDLREQSPSSSNIFVYIKILKTEARARRLAMTLEHFAHILQSDTSKTDKVIADLSDQLGAMAESSGSVRQIGDYLRDAVADIDRRHKMESDIDGLSTGLTFLDDRWQGLKSGALCVLAARPSMGKSVLAMQIAYNATKQGDRALVFSLEMTGIQIAERLAANTGNANLRDISKPKQAGEDFWPKLSKGVQQLKGANFSIDDTAGLHINQICSTARAEHKVDPVGIVVVDHIHIVNADGTSREREMAMISSKLKALAKELDCPVLAVAQLNRGVEQRVDKRPTMADLRDSGSIEQDADIVALLYRDDYYNEDSQAKGIIEVITGKHRSGECGVDRFSARLSQSRIDNMAYMQQVPEEDRWSL